MENELPGTAMIHAAGEFAPQERFGMAANYRHTTLSSVTANAHGILAFVGLSGFSHRY